VLEYAACRQPELLSCQGLSQHPPHGRMGGSGFDRENREALGLAAVIVRPLAKQVGRESQLRGIERQ